MKHVCRINGGAERTRFPFTSTAGAAYVPSPSMQPTMRHAIAAAVMTVGSAPAMASAIPCTPGFYTIFNGETHLTTCVLTAAQTLIVQAGGRILPTSGAAVEVQTGAVAGGITNAGTISGGSGGVGVNVSNSTISGGIANVDLISGRTGILVASGGSVTGGITNSGTVAGTGGSTGAGVRVDHGTITGGITNSGYIVGNSAGITVSGGTIAGGITNSGTIRGGGTGGVMLSDGTIAGGITNVGTITGWNAVVVSGGTITEGFTNAGVIRGVGGVLIVMNGSAIFGGITNAGTISGATGGFVLVDSTVSGGMTNSGTIATDAAGSGVSVAYSSIAGGITNTGRIAGVAAGIFVDAGSTVGGGVTNAGTIAGVTAGIALTSGGTITGGIVNSGWISGGVGIGAGIQMNGGTITGGIRNAGTISAGSSGAGIYMDGATITGSVTNSGTITGGAGIVVVAGSTITGGITNSGTISGPVALYLQGSVAVVRNLAGGLIDGALDIGNAAINVTNAGTIALPAGTPSTIAGNYTQEATGVLRTRVASDTSYGRLSVTGIVTLPSNAKIDVDVANPAHGFTVSGMQDVIRAGTLVSDGTFAVTDNSTLFDFTAVKDGNTVDLVIAAAGTSGVFDAAAAHDNTPAFGAARVLDQVILGNPGGPLAQLFTGLTTQQQVSNAVTQTLPLLAGGSIRLGTVVNGDIGNVVQSHLGASQGMTSGDMFLGDGRFWMKPFGSWASQGERQGIAGYKANVAGLATGVDVRADGPTRLGIAFAYAGAGVDSKSSVAPNRMNTDVYQFVGYGSRRLDEATDLGFQVDVGRNRNRGTRTITFAPSVASSTFESTSFHAGANLARTYPVGANTKLVPSVRLDYTTMKDDGYAETGAGALNLTVDGRRVDQLIAGADVRFVHALSDRTTLSANVGGGYDVLAERSAIVASFAGAPGAAFTTYGADPTPWVGRAGLGATYRTNAGMELTARYDAEYRSDFLNQTASLKLRWMF